MKQFEKHSETIDKILNDEKFKKLYSNWKEKKNKCSYKLLITYLYTKSNKSTIYLTDDTNKLLFNSQLKCTYKNFMNGKIIPSNDYMHKSIEETKTKDKSNIY